MTQTRARVADLVLGSDHGDAREACNVRPEEAELDPAGASCPDGSAMSSAGCDGQLFDELERLRKS